VEFLPNVRTSGLDRPLIPALALGSARRVQRKEYDLSGENER
jgi:hypothetical protein